MRLAIVGMIVWSSAAWAAPGPLADAHAKLDCVQCHDDGNAASSLAKCLGCHAPIGKSTSLHASPVVVGTACGGCHVDHRGRTADISGWAQLGGVDVFDHAATGYRLLGAHALAKCDTCHTARGANGATRYVGLAQTCRSCHQTPHRNAFFDRDCGTCHSPMARSMKTTSIAHAEFPLGKHVVPKLACEGCHTPARGSGKADVTCERCHQTQSHHGKRFGANACGDCHRSGTTWSPSGFNHSTTKFPLNFRHAQLACRDCHRGRDPSDFERLADGTKCKGCHAHRLVHADPEHPLGRYTDAQCLQCHFNPGPVPRRPPFLDAAHGPNGTWPLVNKHKGVPCADCHTTRDHKGKTSFEHVDTGCTGKTCHDGDPHDGKLGAKCESCHAPGAWDAPNFDHDKPFRSGWTFPLRGVHKTQACNVCHPTRDFTTAPVACVGCHAGDDAHRGSLGNQCEGCHADTGDITFDHDRARFKLDGKHKAVACADCHPRGELKPRPTKCAGCHPVPAFHRTARSELAWYDDDCGGCHSARRW